MKKFTSLLTFELHRIQIPYLILLGIVSILQLAAVYLTNQNYVERLEEFIRLSNGNRIDFLAEAGQLSYASVIGHNIYDISILVAALSLLFYAVAIWYRDWRGNDAFSPRLLMLPGSRTPIYFAKFVTILLLIGGLLVLQLFLLVAGERFLEMLTPLELYQSMSIREIVGLSSMLGLVLPTLLIDFILHYSLGIALLAILYLMIIINESFRWKGIFMNVILAGTIVLVLTVLIRSEVLDWLFPEELLLTMVVASLLTGSVATVVSCKLLSNKISI